MAVMAGKDGALKLGEKAIGYIDNFSLNVNSATAETNSIGKDWKEYIEAGKDWSGSLSGTLDYADVGQKAAIDAILEKPTGTALVADFKVGADLTLTGEIVCNSVSITASWGDKISVSINFVGNKALSKKGSSL